MNSFKIKSVAIAVLLAVIFLFCHAPACAQDQSLNSDVILSVIRLLKKSYIGDININQFLNAAAAGGNEYIKKTLKITKDEIPALNERNDAADNMKAFYDNIQNVLYNYNGKIKKSDFIYACLAKMLEVLSKPPFKDPYTVVMTPKEYTMLNEQMSGGNFGGIGIYIQLNKKNDNRLTVVEPVESTPAYRAGIKTGDVIIKINSELTKGMDIDVAAQKIRGKIGTSVILTIDRKGKILNYNIIRATIHVKSAVAKLINKKIGYIKLRIFGENTENEFNEALDKLRQRNAQALILDLRNNTGGYINSSIDVCSCFLPRGSLVVSVINERTNYRQNYYSTGKNGIEMPLLILINEYSASASEITAGALQDTKKAVLLGEKSFGKASVQQLYEFRDGGALKYTVAHYFTPSGKNITEVGIQPDIKVKMDPSLMNKDEDIQLDEAVKYLTKKYSIR